MHGVVIVGGGQAAISATEALRIGCFKGPITLIGNEPHLPYRRPPLSKAFLKGEVDRDSLYFKPQKWYEANQVRLITGTEAVHIAPSDRCLETSTDVRISFDSLIIATGSRARKLNMQGAELENVFTLRTLTDVENLRLALAHATEAVLVGGGYIGLEAAAVLSQLGIHVTLLEALEQPLARVTSPLVSEFYCHLHEQNKVEIRTGVRLEKLQGKDGKVKAVVLDDGSLIPADVVLVAVGIVPNEELAQRAGIACDNGIIVDQDARTSMANIYAAGDCTIRPLAQKNYNGRLESVHNAIEQGRLAAASILGKPRPRIDCPWFWSDQYDTKLQIAGLFSGYDQIIVRGDPQQNKFTAFYLKNGLLLAADSVNSPQEFIWAKRLIIAAAHPDPEQLKDASIAMKDVATTQVNPDLFRVSTA